MGKKKKRQQPNPRRVKCEECDLTFESNNKMKRHFHRIHANVERHFCPECPDIIDNLHDFNVHMRREHMFGHVCGICSMTFLKQKRRAIHEKEAHNYMRSQQTNATNPTVPSMFPASMPFDFSVPPPPIPGHPPFASQGSFVPSVGLNVALPVRVDAVPPNCSHHPPLDTTSHTGFYNQIESTSGSKYGSDSYKLPSEAYDRPEQTNLPPTFDPPPAATPYYPDRHSHYYTQKQVLPETSYDEYTFHTSSRGGWSGRQGGSYSYGRGPSSFSSYDTLERSYSYKKLQAPSFNPPGPSNCSRFHPY